MLKTTASVTAAAWATSLTPLYAAKVLDQTVSGDDKATKKIPIGLQLYSVKKACAKDIAGTIEKVAKMGYQGVEFAGFFKHKADEVRKMLDDNEIVCCGTHARVDSLKGDKFKETLEFHQKLGCPYIIIPALPKDMYRTADDLKKTIEWLNKLNEQMKPYEDMQLGYHAHAQDFHKFDGKTIWETIFDNTPESFVMQLDVGNCLSGKDNPYKILKKYPGRSKTVHLKEFADKRDTPIGEGKVDWKKINEICETVGGTQWYVVEHERAKKPFVSVQACLDNLRKLGY
jgi:sugar phosphate isomerase/epimerase